MITFLSARRFLALLLLFPLCAMGEGTYHIHRLSEPELLQTYLTILREGCQYSEPEWKTSAFDPAAGYWGDGVSTGNEGIRTIAGMVLAEATLVKYDEHLSATERAHALERIKAAVRYATATHLTGNQKCPDGHQWGATEKRNGSGWQSGMWTGSLAFGAHLVFDQLDPDLRKGMERVIGSEADVLPGEPKDNLWLDTKAEENGWETPCLALAAVMFPDNPHAGAWRVKSEEYMMNTLCTPDDLKDSTLVDGKPVNEWVHGPNIQPDFTLENHNIFHPAYVGCSTYFLTISAMAYASAGQPAPESARHHLADIWRMYQTIILPDGEAAYPQGMDWELHGLPYYPLFAALATRDHDALAARLEEHYVQYVRAWQVMRQGNLAPPGSRLGITRHSICAELASYSFLAHKIFGPTVKELSESKADAQTVGVYDHPYVDFIMQRTEKKFASFSWKNRIMGLIMPIADHDEEPFFNVPIANGLVGSFELTGKPDPKFVVLDHSRRKTADGFETTGALTVNGGRLKQTVSVISIGAQTVVYADRVVALSNITVKAERGLPLGIENDEISGGKRTVTDSKHQAIFDYKSPRPRAPLDGSWANVDGRLGMVVLAGSGICYAQATGYSPGVSVCTDLLYGSSSNAARTFKAGDEVARRVAIYFVETSAAETARLAKKCRLEHNSTGDVLHLTQPDGTTTEIPLP